jgi:hypothetical protein
MYPEILEFIEKINELLNLNDHEQCEVEHILFQVYNAGYLEGMEDTVAVNGLE